MTGLVPEGSSLHDALLFVAREAPEPVTYADVEERAAFDTKTLDRLRLKGRVEKVDHAEALTSVVVRTKADGTGPFEYRMTEVGWQEVERLEGTRNL